MAFTAYSDHLKQLHARIFEQDALDEQAIVHRLMQQANLSTQELSQTRELAIRLAKGVRNARLNAGSIDLLTQEFSLDSQEGIALMCMAEAMLRVPDTQTRNKLIRDKVVGQDWHSHIGKSSSLFVNATAWGLALTGKLLKEPDEKSLANALTSVLRRGGEGAVRSGVAFAMKLLGKQFVTGQSIEEAIEQAAGREKMGYRYSYDMLGEAALTPEDADAYYQSYAHTIDMVGKAAGQQGPILGPGVSVKLTGLHPRYEVTQYDRVEQEMYPRLLGLARKAKQWNIGFHLDQEEVARFPLTLEMLTRLAFEPELQGWDGLGISLQAYQKRGRAVVDYLIGLSQESGHRILVRLVKGAYWDTEIKRCQALGLDSYPVFTRKQHSDVSYLACAKALLAAQKEIFPQFATHNAYSIAAAHTLGQGKEYEFQCLHGMGETVYDQIVGEANLNKACRVYAPVGPYATLLAYLVRRLIENGANTSFVNQVVDSSVSIDDIVADPVLLAGRTQGRPNPATPLPRDLLAWRTGAATAGAISSDAGETNAALPPQVDANESVQMEAARQALQVAAEQGLAVWSQRAVSQRARVLEAAAQLLEQGYAPIQQALRAATQLTLAEAAEEQRWAADACRLYASRIAASNEFAQAQPLGVVLVVSPATSPLGWTLAHVAAALAVGNSVLIKTASGQEALALAVSQLLFQAGVHKAAVQVVVGRGKAIVKTLVSDDRTAAIAIGASRATVAEVRQTVKARAPQCRVFARSSGNASMVVDSSALPEQVISDAVFSAFDAAGLRANSLKLICLQDDVADKMLNMLQAMLGERTVGDPMDSTTDIGPLPSQQHADRFEAYLESLFAKGNKVVRYGRVQRRDVPCLVRPAIVELNSIEDLKHIQAAVNGPVLHVLRWKAKDLEALLSRLDEQLAPSFLGLHTRIYETAGEVLSMSKAPNVFVNRPVHIQRLGMQVDAAGAYDAEVSSLGPLVLYKLCKLASADIQVHQGPFKAMAEKSLRQYLNYPVLQEGKLMQRKRHEQTLLDERLRLLDGLCALAASQKIQIGTEQLRRYLTAAIRQMAAKEMPAFMGEENTLLLLPIGAVVCQGPSREGLLAQVMTAVATGNQVLVRAGADAQAYQQLLGPDVCRILTTASAAGSDVPVLSEQDAGLKPLSDHFYPWWQLLSERHITVNSSASGDNTQLMQQDEVELSTNA